MSVAVDPFTHHVDQSLQLPGNLRESPARDRAGCAPERAAHRPVRVAYPRPGRWSVRYVQTFPHASCNTVMITVHDSSVASADTGPVTETADVWRAMKRASAFRFERLRGQVAAGPWRVQESSAPRADEYVIWDTLRSRKPGSLRAMPSQFETSCAI